MFRPLQSSGPRIGFEYLSHQQIEIGPGVGPVYEGYDILPGRILGKKHQTVAGISGRSGLSTDDRDPLRHMPVAGYVLVRALPGPG